MKRTLLTSLLLVACGDPSDFSKAADTSAAVDGLEDSGAPPTVDVYIPPWVGLPSAYPYASEDAAAPPVQDAGGAPPSVQDAGDLPVQDAGSESFPDGSWLCTGSADVQTSARDANAGDVLHCAAAHYPSPASWAALSIREGGGTFQNYMAITFWACGLGTVRVEIPSDRPEESEFGVLIELKDTWTQYRVDYGSQEGFDPATAYGLTFGLNNPWHDEAPAYDLWVDDVLFTSETSTSLGTSEVPCQ